MKDFVFVLKIVPIFLFSLFSAKTDTLRYEINLKEADSHIFEIKLKYNSNKTGVTDFMISQWTPGYYQMLNFSDNVQKLSIKSNLENGKNITKLDKNTWRIPTLENEVLEVSYQIVAKDKFIAKPFIGNEYAFVRPTGVFVFPVEATNNPISVSLKNNTWKNVVSGLDKNGTTLIAKNIDQLLDSPILIGNLNNLGSFDVGGKSHHFYGRELNDFDTKDFMISVKKIVEEATELMGDIPYSHYTFISIGKGNGGIEQTNSTALTFNGELYKTEQGRQKLLDFITHEYFHHYNVKRIRPIELGPFNYSEPNRTKMLWVGEGLTVYYEDIIMNRAGLKSKDQILQSWSDMIEDFQNNEGRKLQTLEESSHNTWEDGPFGIKGKTISFYEKGPLIGMLLDLKIRNNTQNKKSLDDVMRALYQRIYKKENRGYTEQDVRNICEEFAGENLEDIFQYINTLKPIDYNSYFKFAGLYVDFLQNEGKTKVVIKNLDKKSKLQQTIFNDLFRNN